MPQTLDADNQEPLPDGSQLAAVDLGSNSFHLIIAKIEHGEMRPVEALAEKVQLGAGLENGRLTDEAIERGLDCLSRFAQLLESVEPERTRVVGTNALRRAKNRRAFTRPAGKRTARGRPIVNLIRIGKDDRIAAAFQPALQFNNTLSTLSQRSGDPLDQLFVRYCPHDESRPSACNDA